MSIVGGLDIHRKQITFDYPDTVSGEVRRGQIARPTGLTCAPGWPVSPGAMTSRSRSKGAPGGDTSSRSWLPRVVVAHLAEPADSAAARGRKRRAKTDKTDSAGPAPTPRGPR
jgi:transposase